VGLCWGNRMNFVGGYKRWHELVGVGDSLDLRVLLRRYLHPSVAVSCPEQHCVLRECASLPIKQMTRLRGSPLSDLRVSHLASKRVRVKRDLLTFMRQRNTMCHVHPSM
jgi:hypothetical protein